MFLRQCGHRQTFHFMHILYNDRLHQLVEMLIEEMTSSTSENALPHLKENCTTQLVHTYITFVLSLLRHQPGGSLVPKPMQLLFTQCKLCLSLRLLQLNKCFSLFFPCPATKFLPAGSHWVWGAKGAPETWPQKAIWVRWFRPFLL
jgi:hypothetical protein